MDTAQGKNGQTFQAEGTASAEEGPTGFQVGSWFVPVLRRDVKRCAAHVRGEGRAELVVPRHMGAAELRRCIDGHREWIRRKLWELTPEGRIRDFVEEGLGRVEVRRTSRSRMKVDIVPPDGHVRLTMNWYHTQAQVEAFVKQCAPYLQELQRRWYVENENRPYLLETGDMVTVWGEEKRLVVRGGGDPELLIGRLEGKDLVLSVVDPESYDQRWSALTNFYCDIVIREVGDIVARFREKLDFVGRSVDVRHMTSRWGSCSRRTGGITLNGDLGRMPKRLLELVLAHELCHFTVQGHQSDFYEALAELCPDWKERAQELRHWQPMMSLSRANARKKRKMERE